MLAFWSYKHCLPRTQMTGRLASLRGALLSSFLSTAGDWKGCTVLLTTSLPESEQQSRNLTIFVVVDKRGLSLLKGKQWLFQSKIPPRSISGPLLRCHAHVQNSTEPRKKLFPFFAWSAVLLESILWAWGTRGARCRPQWQWTWRVYEGSSSGLTLRRRQQHEALNFLLVKDVDGHAACTADKTFFPAFFFLRQSSFCPETSLDCAQDQETFAGTFAKKTTKSTWEIEGQREDWSTRGKCCTCRIAIALSYFSIFGILTL